MRLLLFGLIAFSVLILAGCTGGARGSTSCKDNTQCKSWQFCNTTSGSCTLLAGYCEANDQCKDEFTECDLNGTHTCVFKEGLCRSSANCQTWQVCDSTMHCRPSPGFCDADEQCDAVFEFCNPSTHKCGPAPGYCNADTDCDSWERCDVVSKRCFLLEGRCDLDGDCENFETCNLKTHFCEPKVGFCQNDDDCPVYAKCDLASKKCVARQGFCVADNECNQWEFCSGQNHTCTPNKDRCGSNEHCGDWQVCDSLHFCKAKLGYCNDNGDCLQGEVCNQQTHRCQ